MNLLFNLLAYNLYLVVLRSTDEKKSIVSLKQLLKQMATQSQGLFLTANPQFLSNLQFESLPQSKNNSYSGCNGFRLYIPIYFFVTSQTQSSISESSTSSSSSVPQASFNFQSSYGESQVTKIIFLHSFEGSQLKQSRPGISKYQFVWPKDLVFLNYDAYIHFSMNYYQLLMLVQAFNTSCSSFLRQKTMAYCLQWARKAAYSILSCSSIHYFINQGENVTKPIVLVLIHSLSFGFNSSSFNFYLLFFRIRTQRTICSWSFNFGTVPILMIESDGQLMTSLQAGIGDTTWIPLFLYTSPGCTSGNAKHASHYYLIHQSVQYPL